MKSSFNLAALGAAAIALSACGGGSGGAGGGGGGSVALTCQDRFNPDAAAAGADCTPVYGRYCASSGGNPISNQLTSVTPCEGVEVSEGTVTASNREVDYVLLQPSSGTPSGLYVALHWDLGTGAAMAERMRLSELVKGRGLAVIAPTAPARTWDNNLLLLPGFELEPRLAVVDALIARAQSEAGVQSAPVISGVSDGAGLAFAYGCERAASVAGVLLVAAALDPAELPACQPSVGLPTVQVHGTSDLYTSYDAGVQTAGAVPTYQRFREINGCTGDPSRATLPSPDERLIEDIVIDYDQACATGVGSALVTVEGGGHTWPGLKQSFAFPINLFGTTTKSFDATLQGYDLLRFVGG